MLTPFFVLWCCPGYRAEGDLGCCCLQGRLPVLLRCTPGIWGRFGPGPSPLERRGSSRCPLVCTWAKHRWCGVRWCAWPPLSVPMVVGGPSWCPRPCAWAKPRQRDMHVCAWGRSGLGPPDRRGCPAVRVPKPILGGVACGGVLGRLWVFGGPSCCPRGALEPSLGGTVFTCVHEGGGAALGSWLIGGVAGGRVQAGPGTYMIISQLLHIIFKVLVDGSIDSLRWCLCDCNWTLFWCFLTWLDQVEASVIEALKKVNAGRRKCCR
jgi:hypothetical protein